MALLVDANDDGMDLVNPKNEKFTLDEYYETLNCKEIEKFKQGTKCFVWDANAINKELPENEVATAMFYAECDGFPKIQVLRGSVLVCEFKEVN